MGVGSRLFCRVRWQWHRPLIVYAILPSHLSALIVSLFVSILMLAGIGVARAKSMRKPLGMSAVQVTVLGTAALTLAFGIGNAGHAISEG